MYLFQAHTFFYRDTPVIYSYKKQIFKKSGQTAEEIAKDQNILTISPKYESQIEKHWILHFPWCNFIVFLRPSHPGMGLHPSRAKYLPKYLNLLAQELLFKELKRTLQSIAVYVSTAMSRSAEIRQISPFMYEKTQLHKCSTGPGLVDLL